MSGVLTSNERIMRSSDVETGLINLAGAPPSWAGSFTWRMGQRKSLWRLWKQLSRLQRSLLLVLAVAALLLVASRMGQAPVPAAPVAETGRPPEEATPRQSLPSTSQPPEDIKVTLGPSFLGATPETASSRLFQQSVGLRERREAVVDAFRHAWKGYKAYAWGQDHLRPLSRTGHTWFGLGLTIIDGMDTMYLMGLHEELATAQEWVAHSLQLAQHRDVNVFETTIRVLGGLLSMHTLTEEQLYLDKAKKAFAVSELLHQLPKKEGLVPMFINAETGRFNADSTLTLGARADSYYEYLLKQWLQTGKTIDWLKDDYLAAVEGVQKHLVRRSEPNKLLFIGELVRGRTFYPKMDHLVCYFPGTLMLGHVVGGMPQGHMELALDLMDTCIRMYSINPTFLSPEIAHFNLKPQGTRDILIKGNDAHNLLRPETLESLWYMYYFTRNETYRDLAWRIFQGFEKHCKVPGGGYTTIGSVLNTKQTGPRDMMESFFLAETLKYLFLLFSEEDVLERYSPTRYLFNTEAHLLPLYTS
ncbi:alpha-Mannosidase class I b isoform X4 [Dermacentor variabilis]|uniref:alpha-Mannosidase class I b isoform X4 n=1 Tax=Dermacentor variabilis TaxID=34621 RepID=UPI003F5AE8A4